MAIFENIKYHFFDENGKLLGDYDRFLGGLEKFKESAYVKKYIDEVYKETITICDLKDEKPNTKKSSYYHDNIYDMPVLQKR